VRYDPALGYLPTDDPVAPWEAEIDPETTVEIVDGRLRISDPPTRTETVGDKNVAFTRSEPALGDPGSWLYLMQVSFKVDKVHYYPGDPDEAFATFGAAGRDRFGLFSVGMYAGQRVVVAGGEIDWSGDRLLDPTQVAPWDFRRDATYTMVVHVGQALYLLVDGQPVMSWPYASLPPTGLTSGPAGVFGFTSTGSLAEFGPLQYCVCGSAPVTGPSGKLSVAATAADPDPFDPAIGPARLTLNTQVLELPGSSSGKFDYSTRVTWEIAAPSGSGVERVIQSDHQVAQPGSSRIDLIWDGQNSTGEESADAVYSYRVLTELVRTKRQGGQTHLLDAVILPWRELTLERAQPVSSGGDDPARSGIWIDRLEATEGERSCLAVDLRYSLAPTGSRRARSYVLEYHFDSGSFAVDGLPESRQIPAHRLERTEVVESFTVCPHRPQESVETFSFQIVARSREQVFRTFPTVTFIRGAAGWDATLLPTITNLRQLIESGNADAEIRRAFSLATTAYVWGGYAGWDAEVDRRLGELVASFEVSPPMPSIEAYGELLRLHGDSVSVGYGIDNGSIHGVDLDGTIELGPAYTEPLADQLTTGLLPAVIGLQPGDELRLHTNEARPAGAMVTYYRYHDGYAVAGDYVRALVRQRQGSYYLQSLDVALGDLGGQSCTGASSPAPAASEPTIPLDQLIASQTRVMITPWDGGYRCAETLMGEWNDPGSTEEGAYLRVVDVDSGEVLQDGLIEMGDGQDSDLHTLRVSVGIPYRPGLPFQHPTTIIGGELHLYTGHSTPESLAEYATSLDPPLSVPFTPAGAFPEWMTELDHDSYNYRYMIRFEQEHPKQFKFTPNGYYLETFHSYLFEELIRHSANASEENKAFTYYLPWRYDAQATDPANECQTGWKPGEMPGDAFCSSKANRARTVMAEGYFWAQYARTLWAPDPGANGEIIWAGGPDTNMGDNRWVNMDVSDDTFEKKSCGYWGGARTVFMYFDLKDDNDQPECKLTGYGNTIPHELSHWAGNVLPFNYTIGSGASARNEGFADASAFMLKANFDVGRLKHYKNDAGTLMYSHAFWQYENSSLKAHRWYRGNSLYADIDDSHYHREVIGKATAHAYFNSPVWSGAWLQYSNLVGSYYAFPTNHESYWGIAYDSWPGENWRARHEHTGYFPHQLRAKARKSYRAMLSHEVGRDTTDHASTDHQVVADTRVTEIQKAYQGHGWDRKSTGNAERRSHPSSASPSHAMAITLNDNAPSEIKVRWDRIVDTNWANFFVHANVKYVLRAMGPLNTRLRLFQVVDVQRQGETVAGLQAVAMNTGCASPTTGGPGPAPVTVHPNDGVCFSGGAGVGESTIVFTPRQSGWYYASAYSGTGGAGSLSLEAADQSRQITSTTRNRTSVFDRKLESRLGQSIPVNLPNALQVEGDPNSPTMVTRSGVFRGGSFLDDTPADVRSAYLSEEEHYWRFQILTTRSYQDSNGQVWSNRDSTALAFADDAEYKVAVNWIKDPREVLDATLFVARSLNEEVAVYPIEGVTASELDLGGNRLQKRWSIGMKELSQFLYRNGIDTNGITSGMNIYVTLRYRKGAPLLQGSPSSLVSNEKPYVIRVDSVSNGASGYPALEDDSNAFNPISLRRWCSEVTWAKTEHVTRMERIHDTFSINERLSYHDADYYSIWLQEGEHLNVTYRGEIPAAIDVSGTSKVLGDQVGLSSGDVVQMESDINYMWRAMLDEKNVARVVNFAYHDRAAVDSMVLDWRPVIGESPFDFCDSYYNNNCNYEIDDVPDPSAQERALFAERGYLWAYNVDPGTSGFHFEPTSDNSIHLTMTAFITGPYIVRVRGQEALYGPRGNNYYKHHSMGNGAPYTLNVNMGVLRNKMRPYWQYNDAGSDPSGVMSPASVCGR
jgi:hypothetical protein